MTIFLNVLWAACAAVNIILLYYYLFVTARKEKKNYGWVMFFTFFAAVFGPFWTLFLVITHLPGGNDANV